MAKITLAGESLIAQKIGSQQALEIARFIYANVPGLNPATPVDRAAAKPPAAQIVHTYTIPPENAGYVNPNQVVYSSMLGSDLGDFDFNWIGLESAEGVLFAVAYVALQQKRKNIPPNQTGNNITRNVLVEYNGAQAITGITIDAKTWQHDFTVRLAGIDERTRLSNRDTYGRSCFIAGAFQLEKVGSTYQLKAGHSYLEGIRFNRGAAMPVTLPALPAKLWLDVYLERQGNDLVPVANAVFGTTKADYTDAAGAKHYLIPVADISGTAAITDLRTVEPISIPLVKAFATVKSVTDLVDGTTPAGKAKQLETARKVSFSGAGTGSADFDGSKDVAIQLTLADSGVQAGTYPKVQVNAKGLVVGYQALAAGDIPALDWSKISTGKPTSLAGYGITDGMQKGAGGLMTTAGYVNGRIADLDANQFISFANLATDKPAEVTYGVGIHLKWPTGKYAVDFVGSIDSDWFGARHVLSDGTPGPWRAFWHSGNFTPSNYALKSTTLAGYSIGDAYTMTQTNAAIQAVSTALLGGVAPSYDTLQKLASGKADKSTTLGGYGIADAYTKTQTDSAITTAVSGLRGGVSATYDTLQKIAQELVKKANSGTTLAAYGITDTSTTTQMNAAIAAALTAFLPKRSFATNDFIRIPDVVGGLIFQFGTTQVTAEGTSDVTLPMSFNTPLGGTASVAADVASTQGNYSAYARLVSKSTLRLTQDVSTNTGATTQYINWLCWGF